MHADNSKLKYLRYRCRYQKCWPAVMAVLIYYFFYFSASGEDRKRGVRRCEIRQERTHFSSLQRHFFIKVTYVTDPDLGRQE
jgi:hypothetical protein